MDIEQTRKEIARLMAIQMGRSDVSKELTAMQNRLAYLTATLYVVIDNGRDIEVCGVSKEVVTVTQGLTLSLLHDTADLVCVKHEFLKGRIGLYLHAGDPADFKLVDDSENLALRYRIRVFKTVEEATTWMQEQRDKHEASRGKLRP